jgi:predicted aspartyl protease
MLATMVLRKQRLPRGGAPVRTPSMGMTVIRGTVQRPDGRGRRRRLTFLVDSGAIYSVLPAGAWEALGLTPTRHAEFALADGTTVGRGVAEARFTIAGLTATSPVVCGEDRDNALLGAVTLETLGLMLNPLSRELLPMRLLLG